MSDYGGSDDEGAGSTNAAPVAAKRTAAPPPAGGSLGSEIEKLAALHKAGALTDKEFAAAKAKLLR